jgi:hypothetical protein
MSVAQIAPLRAMLRAPSKPVLWCPTRVASAGEGGGTPGTAPNSISGLSGWWDASNFANVADASGNPLSGWGLPIANLIDLSGGQRSASPFFFSSNSNQPIATPRLSGMLGGVGHDLGTGPYYPFLDPNLGVQVPNVPMDATVPWTRLFVWSRPNWKQSIYSPYTDSSNHVLICSGSTAVLQLDGTAGASQLVLFPGGSSATVLSSVMTRRHTHALVIRNTPNVGIDVWLDGIQTAAGVTNPVVDTGLATLLLGHDGVDWTGGAQCWFHELATWERALSAQEIGGLNTYATRWALGVRKGLILTFNGQSNANNAVISAGADVTLAQGVAWWLGALAYGRASQTQTDGGPGTMVPGMGIYYQPEINPTYAGTFLQDPQDGSDPSGWSPGTMGSNVGTFLASLAAEDQADVAALVLWWSETDSYRSYATEWTRYQHAANRWIAVFRSMIPGATAASMPVIWWNAIPFGNTDGIQMQREVVASLVADATLNVVMGNPMTADSNNNGASYDATTGIQTGGDPAHRDLPDLTLFARRAAPLVARALYATGRSDSLSAVPVGLPTTGGPTIVHAWRQSDTSVVLTVQHDAGNDLIVPLLAQQGQGFLVMDGGSVTTPGTLVPAVACVRIDATHLQLTMSQALVNPSTECLLFYPYGSYAPANAPTYNANMGRGNAVTDNFSSLLKPEGWDIGNDLGSAWNINYPLAATTMPIALSDDQD